MHLNWLCLLLVVFALGACTNDSNPATKTAQAADPRRGRGIYLSSCVACHNSDPSKDGPIGPAVSGSSRELIEARILRASYPPGYSPKRPTGIMPAMPFLESAIPHLAAYLSDSKKQGVG